MNNIGDCLTVIFVWLAILGSVVLLMFEQYEKSLGIAVISIAICQVEKLNIIYGRKK